MCSACGGDYENPDEGLPSREDLDAVEQEREIARLTAVTPPWPGWPEPQEAHPVYIPEESEMPVPLKMMVLGLAIWALAIVGGWALWRYLL